MVLAHNIQDGHRTRDIKVSEDITFETMLLTASTLEGLTKSGFNRPSPIQLHGIPLGKCGFDLLLEAKSGTGKTAVFTVIALEKLDLNKGIQTVILAPTREIAAQICSVIRQIGSNYDNLNVEVVMGGMPIQEDVDKFKKRTHIVVGSPGRLKHLIQDKYIDTSAVRLLILDEADKLMAKSFQSDINFIFSILPKQKQVIMSSATYPEALKSVIYNYVQNVQHICPDSTSILLGIKQLFTIVKSHTNIVRQTNLRFDELRNILSKREFKQCLIFCNYQVRVGELCKMLIREKWPADQLHGQQEQTDRLEALKTLQEYKCRILVSTDLAARGIDASNVDLIINFEPPFEWPTYLHRIGRAGRFGSYGIAITILSEGQEQLKFKKMIESMNVSLDLRNLWNNDEFILDTATPHSNGDTNLLPCQDEHKVTKDVCMNLWDILTQENAASPKEIVNFQELNDSFNNCNDDQISSFSDLVNSFDNHTVDVEEGIPYKYFKFHKISICNTSISHNINMNIDKDLQRMNYDGLGETNNSERKINTSHLEELKQDLELNSHNYKNNNDEISIHKIDLNAFNAVDANYGKKEIDVLYSNEEGINEALLNSGLPTSFGKSSHKENRRKSKKKRTNHVKTSNVDGHGENNEINDEYYDDRPKIAHTSAQDTQYEKYIDDGYNTQSQRCQSNRIKTQHFTGRINKCNIRSSPINTEHNNYKANNNYKNYLMWYNQLKRHIKQVEVALYIEELTKMK